ncbi:hypothetical protein CK203_062497 [Vitis vinifera]|uniref:Reverse transcriptase zinc-binding domain-containing protein n=1 Tax=Vitis vinifera TaxID=29760 RepID=A0A438G4P6_VITVI|nr:hypothetical protein CK203_062497 [Vitis vinifera]
MWKGKERERKREGKEKGRQRGRGKRKKRAPTKVAFFAWEATWGKVLTLDRLQRRG